MITNKERVEQFKRDCRSYRYYQKCINECNQHIEMLDVKLTGLSSPNGNQGPKCENATRPSTLEIIMEQDKWIQKRNDFVKKIDEIDRMIKKIVDPTDKMMVIDLLIYPKSKEYLLNTYYYSNLSHIHRHVNGVLKKII